MTPIVFAMPGNESRGCDWLVTVDPHLHRVRSLDAIYGIETSVVSSAPCLARSIAARVGQPLLVGPDEESEQWVAHVASAIGRLYGLLRKTRSGDRDVLVAGPGYSGWQGCTPSQHARQRAGGKGQGNGPHYAAAGGSADDAGHRNEGNDRQRGRHDRLHWQVGVALQGRDHDKATADA